MGGGCKKGCGLKLRDTWSEVYCLGNQTVGQRILEKLLVPVFLRSWKYWCKLNRLWSVIMILRLFGSLQEYKILNNCRLQHFSVSLSFFSFDANCTRQASTSCTFGFVAQYSGLVSEIITEEWVVHTKEHVSET